MNMTKNDKLVSLRTKIDHYSYLSSDIIGKGYSSNVYKGKNDKTNSEIAIKMITMRVIEGSIQKNLLTNELLILKKIKGMKYIVQLQQILINPQQTCIITELCDGGQLSKMIRKKKFLGQFQALPILKQIVIGYSQLDEAGIIHRDLKPANILFKNNQVRIVDFGFAITSQQSQTPISYNIGSPVYMPPEALCNNIYSVKSDIWAIGVIYFEMLTGKTPWKANSQNQLKKQMKNVQIKQLLPLHLSELSKQFLIKTLEVNPKLRISSKEMIKLLQLTNELIKPLRIMRQIPQFSQKNYKDNSELNQGELTKGTFGFTHTFPQEVIETNLGHNTTNNKDNLKTSYPLVPVGKSFRLTDVKKQKYLNQLQGKLKKVQNIDKEEKLTECPESINETRISKQLTSQIHFCRFMYKLLGRISNKPTTQNLQSELYSLIFQKLNDIQNLKILSKQIACKFISTHKYQQINHVVKQYISKYRQQRNIACVQTKLQIFNEHLLDKILSLYNEIKRQNEIINVKQQIILLDYLIALKKLLQLNSKDLQTFRIKSNIQVIVSGKPAHNITSEHILAIQRKLKIYDIV